MKNQCLIIRGLSSIIYRVAKSGAALNKKKITPEEMENDSHAY